MTGIVIYKSKYGATAQYAHWIGEELNVPVCVATLENQQIFNYCQYIVLGTSVYEGKLLIAKWIRRNRNILANKKIFLFIVCGTPASEVEKLNDILKRNIPADLLNNSEVFFLRGRMIKGKLTGFDRFILKMGASITKDPIERKNMLTDFDEVNKENLTDFISTIRKHTRVSHPLNPAEESPQYMRSTIE